MNEFIRFGGIVEVDGVELTMGLLHVDFAGLKLRLDYHVSCLGLFLAACVIAHFIIIK